MKWIQCSGTAASLVQEEEVKRVKDVISKRKPDIIVVSAVSRYCMYPEEAAIVY